MALFDASPLADGFADGRRAQLLNHHGLYAVGRDAAVRAVQVEQQHIRLTVFVCSVPVCVGVLARRCRLNTSG